MTQYNPLLQRITELVYQMSIECHNIRLSAVPERELLYAKAILRALNNNMQVFSILDRKRRIHLAESIKASGEMLFQKYAGRPELKLDALELSAVTNEAFGQLVSASDKTPTQYGDVLVEPFYNSFSKVLEAIQTFWDSRFQNKEAIEYIHAFSIASRMENAELPDHSRLIELLLLVKELWNMDYRERGFFRSDSLSIAEKFYLKPAYISQIKDKIDYRVAFRAALKSLTRGSGSILRYLGDEQLASLYTRLNAYKTKDPGLKRGLRELQKKIYIEAQLRYSCSKLGDTSYQLLTRFQNFDSITRQVENMELNILEAYLFRRANFAREILVHIAKHADNIKALLLNKNRDLQEIFDYIATKLNAYPKGANGSLAMLRNLVSGMNNNLLPHLKRRYAGLDRFTTRALRAKYSKLFTNILGVFKNADGCKEFLHRLLVCRLAADYCFQVIPDSVEEVRAMASNRKQVISMLSSVSFLDIFAPGNFNKIASFNFSGSGHAAGLKSPARYVKFVIDNITVQANAFQLEVLYTSVLSQDNPTETGRILLNSIKTQIRQRMTMRKALYTLIFGRRKEYDKLRFLRKISVTEPAYS